MVIADLWIKAAKNLEMDAKGRAVAIYFALNDRVPEESLDHVNTAVDLYVYMKSEEGVVLSREELNQVTLEMLSVINNEEPEDSGRGWIVFLPPLCFLLSVLSAFFGRFSWVVVLLGVFAWFYGGAAFGNGAVRGDRKKAFYIVAISIFASLLNLVFGFI